MARPKASYFRQGMIESLPFLVVIIPFALLFGVVGTEAGMNLSQVFGFSFLVIAGASQFATVQLLVDQAPAAIAVLTGLAVNMRMAMYSASLAPYVGNAPAWKRGLMAYVMIDNAYASSMLKYEEEPQMTVSERYSYYFGVVSLCAPAWYGFTLVGAIFGKAIPPEFALDFALPIAFLSLIGPALKTLAHVVAALVSIVFALVLAFLPFGSGLLIAAVLAMMAGARVELWMTRGAR